jgi:hypothetical protein
LENGFMSQKTKADPYIECRGAGRIGPNDPTRLEVLSAILLTASALAAPEFISDDALAQEKTQPKWSLSSYFEACSRNVVCPCLFSPAPPLTSQPTEGDCHVVLLFIPLIFATEGMRA